MDLITVLYRKRRTATLCAPVTSGFLTMRTWACEAGDRSQAFEQAAIALTEVVTEADVRPLSRVEVRCEAPDIELLLVEWLNAIIFEMATRNMLFGRFAAQIQDTRLAGVLWGWSAACVVDV